MKFIRAIILFGICLTIPAIALAENKIKDQYNPVNTGVTALGISPDARGAGMGEGIMRFVSSNTNYVEVNDGQGIIQTAFTNFVYNWSPNGLGGVTVQGSVNGISMRQDKDGNIYYNYGINGIAVSATVSIVLTGGTNQASVTINPNFSGNTLTMNGYLVPYNESGVFQGTTW